MVQQPASGQKADDAGLLCMTGSIEHVIYANEENGFAICDLGTEAGDLVTLTGTMPYIGEGDSVTVYGKWVHNPKYGRQFRVESCERRMPADAASMLRYLASGAIKGIGPKTAQRMVDEFGDETFDVIEHHPEWLAAIPGISVKKAKSIGEDFTEKAGIRSAMMFFRDYFGAAATVRIYKRFGGTEYLYDQKQYETEKYIATKLLLLDRVAPAMETANIGAFISREQEETGVRYAELQRKAITDALENGVMLLTGGPGTGKTTTINTIIRFFEMEGRDILLAAPTGRAAKRMTEATGYEARTIHRLLEINGAVEEDTAGARFERNEENPLEADVVIIDEMSMVDIHLFRALLAAVSVGTRLIMVGDVDQLPSVGPGQVLHDLMESRAFPVVILKKIFRQAGESDIVVNAHKINRGEEIILNNKSKDFFFLERKDAGVIYKHMIQLIREMLPKYVEAKPYEIQVLTPMRKGNLGVEVLNGILQKYLNPPSEKKKEYASGEKLFREGDKVMQVKNNYQITWEILSKYGIPIDKGTGVFNGDMGMIVEINDTAQLVTVEFDEQKRIEYPYGQLDELELAYAVTIHKSQGSEYPAVILPLLSGPKMLFNRNLLYTAVTRARKCVTILGSAETVAEMIHNEKQHRRYTSLCDRIKETEGMEEE